MIHEDITLSGSLTISGSINTPRHASDDLATAETGSIYHNTTDNVLKVYTGTEWVVVGDQTTPIAAPSDVDIEYLVVAGGGGAGWDLTAGGGAGGLLSSSLSSIESGSSITVTVGAGGAGYTSGGVTSTADGTASSIASAAGTAFTTVSTVGGGGGSRVATTDGRDGGSGGGCGRGNQGATNPGSGTVGQGNDGGADTDSPAGTGGGGAGAAGGTASGTGNPSTGGNGGDGLASSITGTSTTYAGGGGGGGYYGSAGTGGSGGGGNGSGGNAQSNQENGEANKGGGAGGGGQNSPVAASGGSGVVILAYPTGSFTGNGGIKTSRSDGHFVHQFKESGTFTLGGANDYPVAPSDHFTPVIYTGNGTSQTINTGFTPDLVWLKSRSVVDSHQVYDTIRGETKGIFPNLVNDESVYTDNRFGFETNGFSVGTTNSGYNQNNATYVAWCWKGGGTAVSNTDGSITSNVSANTKAGFSVVKYTGNATNGATVGHGLSSAPEMIIIKNLDDDENWSVYSSATGSSQVGHLNLTNAFSTTGDWNDTAPTSTVFTVGTSNRVNTTDNFIAYCWHSVSGHSKIGSYTGVSGDITVTTGFRPRFVMVKRANSTGHWEMHDSQRFPTINDENGASSRLRANDNSTEASFNNSPIFFTATGFVLDSSVSANSYGDYDANGSTYIYLAIAE